VPGPLTGFRRQRRRSTRALAPILLALATTIALLTGPLASSQAFSVNNHEGITFDGLSERPLTFSFLRPAVFDDIADQHEQIDSGLSGARDERHFDDCEFDGAVEYINDRYDDAIADLSFGGLFGGLWNSTDEFGLALHPAQDLYAHSNWVEMGFPLLDNPATPEIEVSRTDLINISRSTPFPGHDWRVPTNGGVVRGDILLGNDDWTIPQGWSIDGDGGGLHVPTLINPSGSEVGRILMTGEGTLDDECDVHYEGGFVRAFNGFEHSVLNKDDDSRPGYEEARALAVLQTSYEWCRLLAKAGEAGIDGLLAALWVRSGGLPHPPGTPCAAAPPGGRQVTVSIDRIRVLDSGDNEDNQPGEVQIAVALYDHPSLFTRSVHSLNLDGSVELNDGELMPSSRLPSPLTLCADTEDRITLAVHGWDNDDPSGDLYANDFDDKGDNDEVLVGFQRRFGTSLPDGVQVSTAADLRVTYHFGRGGDACDERTASS
jgi:hypothetical protein